MEGRRGKSAAFFSANGARARRIDRGGSVWRIELDSLPTAAGLEIDEFARALLDDLVGAFRTVKGDHVFVAYASESRFRQLK